MRVMTKLHVPLRMPAKLSTSSARWLRCRMMGMAAAAAASQ
jgi:hypothetical protein